MTDKIACVDFDGVIHPYHGWIECCKVARHPPIEGVYYALLALRNSGYKIYIFTARDLTQVAKWLQQTGWTDGFIDQITNVKPPATVFFDDRAVHVPANKKHGLLNATTHYLLEPWETH